MRNISLMCALSMAACAADETGETSQQLPNGGVCEETPTGCECQGSPIVLDLTGQGFHFSNPAGGVPFALAGSGQPWQWSWPVGHNVGFLVFDRNHNGVIDDGTEMFGDATLFSGHSAAFPVPQDKRPNGFNALAFFDTAKDGRIDRGDAVFPLLQVWVDDAPRDGITQPGELRTLADIGVTAISLRYRAGVGRDANGNELRYVSDVSVSSGSTVGPLTYDVFLAAPNAIPDGGPVIGPHLAGVDPGTPSSDDYTVWSCYGWAYLRDEFQVGPCNSPEVMNDNVVFLPAGGSGAGLSAFWRQVVRTAVNQNADYAIDQLMDSLYETWITSGCSAMNIPNATFWPRSETHDYMDPPYMDTGRRPDGSQRGYGRVKCFSSVVRTPSGPAPGPTC